MVHGRGRRSRDSRIKRDETQEGWLTPYKKRGDRRTHIDLAELPETMRRAGRPGPKPQARRGADDPRD